MKLATVWLGVVVSLVTGCAANESAAPVHTPKHVETAFARAELPLRTQGLNDPDTLVVNPSGAPLPRDSFAPTGGESFYVVLYETAEDAAEIVKEAPPIDPVRGQRRVFLRNANVVAVVQPPDADLIARLEPIVASL